MRTFCLWFKLEQDEIVVFFSTVVNVLVDAIAETLVELLGELVVLSGVDLV